MKHALVLVSTVVLASAGLLGCETTTAATATASPALDTRGVEALPVVKTAEPQPLLASALRVEEALESLGSGIRPEDRAALQALAQQAVSPETTVAVQHILDPYCLASVQISPEARVKVVRGPADAVLQQEGWRTFLVKVHNEAATRAKLEWTSPNAEPVLHGSTGAPNPKPENLISPGEVDQRFLELDFYRKRPMAEELTGLPLEYHILQILTRVDKPREAALGFHVGQGTQDIGGRNDIHVLFDVEPSTKVVFRIKDDDGAPAMASFTIRDNHERLADESDGDRPKDYRNNKALQTPWQRPGLTKKALAGVYPLPSRRVADRDEFPDFFFQPQIYRSDGEHVFLPPGTYDVTFTRGPEYLPDTRQIVVKDGAKEQEEIFQLKRWIHLADMGWYSGDHHVHAGGCSHYESPEAGVKPEAMMRQALGEDLNVSSVLSWGPCWYHQKTFFEGDVHRLSSPFNLIRYDVEVSGFPSSHAGHVCLLRLKEDDYPGTTLIEEWPTFTLPVLQWAQKQGGVVGYAHSGWGLEPMEPTNEFPNFVMPKFDGIGANEYIVTATHNACDFISAGDTPLPLELNIWYHVLNCGYRTAISGETDFPCIFDERVGMARTYAKLGKTLNFDTFAQKIREGAGYVSDGRSHIMDFAIDGQALGQPDNEIALSGPKTVQVTAQVAAYLPAVQDEAGAAVQGDGIAGRPYWHLEKSRVAGSRRVPVELVVNGTVVAKQEIEADGVLRPVTFTQAIDHSAWVALRILASTHTNPIFVLVDGKPIRGSKQSAQWCRAAVDRCWQMKEPAIRAEEKAAAQAAYDHARAAYDKIIAESPNEGGAVLPVSVRYSAGFPQPEKGTVIPVYGPHVAHTGNWNYLYANTTSFQSHAFAVNKGDGTQTFRWNLGAVAPGQYEVLAWVPRDTRKERSPAAPYVVQVATGTKQDVTLDQTAQLPGWQELGTFAVDKNSYVELRDTPNARVVADALLLVPVK